MTNRKKQLTELAQRVMDGLSPMTTLREWRGREDFYYSIRHREAIAAIKSLEQELLPNWCETVVVYSPSLKAYQVNIVSYLETEDDEGAPYWSPHKAVEATASTEEAARLAALLLALAEMKEE